MTSGGQTTDNGPQLGSDGVKIIVEYLRTLKQLYWFCSWYLMCWNLTIIIISY